MNQDSMNEMILEKREAQHQAGLRLAMDISMERKAVTTYPEVFTRDDHSIPNSSTQSDSSFKNDIHLTLPLPWITQDVWAYGYKWTCSYGHEYSLWFIGM